MSNCCLMYSVIKFCLIAFIFLFQKIIFFTSLIFFSSHSNHFQKFYEKTEQCNGRKDFQVVTQHALVEEAALPDLLCSGSVCLSFIHQFQLHLENLGAQRGHITCSMSHGSGVGRWDPALKSMVDFCRWKQREEDRRGPRKVKLLDKISRNYQAGYIR